MAIFLVVAYEPTSDDLIGTFTLEGLIRYLERVDYSPEFGVFVSDGATPFCHPDEHDSHEKERHGFHFCRLGVCDPHFYISVDQRCADGEIFSILFSETETVDSAPLPPMNLKQLADFLSQIDLA